MKEIKEEEKKETKVRSRALNLLSYRARSVHELRVALKERAFSDTHIDETIDWLKEFGYLDDEKFASELAASRVRNKNWGSIKIASDLAKRGIETEIIKSVTAELFGEGEESTAGKALERWLAKRNGPKDGPPTLPLDKNVYASAFRHLQSRGFPSSVIYQALKTLKPLSDDDIE
ncbi:MAG: regulatory protein RecX [Thermodesulfobacteriota bacterium]